MTLSSSSLASLPKRKRSRGSSEEFVAGSLGSFAGSPIGSIRGGIEALVNNGKPSPVPKLPELPKSANLAQTSSDAPKPPPAVASAPADTSADPDTEIHDRKPLKRKRGYSVDFTFNVDDEPVEKVLPPMDPLRSMSSLPSFEHTSSSLLKSAASESSVNTQGLAISALDQLDALGEEAGLASAKIVLPKRKESLDEASNASSFASQSQQMLLEAFISYSEERYSRRDRFESWGAMSDLSAAGLGGVGGSSSSSMNGTAAAAALAATALEYTELAGDAIAAANLDMDFPPERAGSSTEIPSRVALKRDRLLSVTSAATDVSTFLQSSAEGEQENQTGDIQAYLQAAMADLADAVEYAAEPGENDEEALIADPGGIDSDLDSLLGAALDGDPLNNGGRSRSLSVSSTLNISVDYDAVAAAVDAAEAIDLNALGNISGGDSVGSTLSLSSKRRRRLSSHNGRVGNAGSSRSASAHSYLPHQRDEREMEVIRQRARAAAGYVPPASADGINLRTPAKKQRRSLYDTPETPIGARQVSATAPTPQISNLAGTQISGTPLSSTATPSSSTNAAISRGQCSQKWEGMFDCLIMFVEHKKAEETKGMSSKEAEEWVWDGNVPTTYKTPDGKALGRWVNNQRSAKSKGVLKEDREERLVQAGLKWSVLASSSWNDMLEELRFYVREQTQNGRKWDGNVPTNYQVKVRLNDSAKGKTQVEDKNLGRWVNRQRSLYQAGRLRKDRQQVLEEIGLKWSMLATTSWDSMFSTLCKYIEDKSKNGNVWDGNVPANYKTNGNPPRALGRWINRQRSAHVKGKLKVEYVEKLSAVGLKWCVHERRVLDNEQENPQDVPSSSASMPATSKPHPTVSADPSDGSTDDCCVIVKTVPAKRSPATLTTPVRAVSVAKGTQPGSMSITQIAGAARKPPPSLATPVTLKSPPGAAQTPGAPTARKLAFTPSPTTKNPAASTARQVAVAASPPVTNVPKVYVARTTGAATPQSQQSTAVRSTVKPPLVPSAPVQRPRLVPPSSTQLPSVAAVVTNSSPSRHSSALTGASVAKPAPAPATGLPAKNVPVRTLPPHTLIAKPQQGQTASAVHQRSQGRPQVTSLPTRKTAVPVRTLPPHTLTAKPQQGQTADVSHKQPTAAQSCKPATPVTVAKRTPIVLATKPKADPLPSVVSRTAPDPSPKVISVKSASALSTKDKAPPPQAGDSSNGNGVTTEKIGGKELIIIH